jgi:hypothetical protein
MSLATWSQSRREKPPEVFRLFCHEWLRLSGTKTDQFWKALAAAQWSRAVAMRSAVALRSALPHRLAALEHLARHNLSPDELIAVLEGLVTERLLAPKTARTIEDHVLERTTKEGRWK